MSKRRTRRLWALAGLVLALLLLRSVLSPSRTQTFRDTLPITAAQNVILKGALGRGELPEWNSSQYAGVPMLANPATHALYPPRWIAVLATSNPSEANDLFGLLHVLLALLGGVALGRELGLGRPGRRVLGLSYALGGPFLSLLTNAPYLAAATWAPFALAMALRARRKSTPSALGLAGLGLALPFYAGDPQLAGLLALLAALVLVGPSPSTAPPRGLGQRLLAPLLLGGITLLFTAALLLPTLALFGETDRAGMDYSIVGAWSFHPARLSELLVPFPLGLPYPERATYLGQALDPQVSDQWTHTLFLGALPFLFLIRALASVPERLRRARVAFGCLALAALLLAFGRYTPLHPWLYEHTPYGAFRYPEKHLTLVALALASLAAIGLEAWLAAEPWKRPRQLLPYLALPGAALLSAWPLSLWADSLLEGNPGLSAPSLAPQIAAVVLAQLGLLGLLALPRLSLRRRGIVVVVLVGLTLLSVNSALVFAGNSGLGVTPPPVVTYLRQAGQVDRPLAPRVARIPPHEPFGRLPLEGRSLAEAGVARGVFTLSGASCALFRLNGAHGMVGFQPKRMTRLLGQTKKGVDPLARGAVQFVVGPLEKLRLPRLSDAGLGVGVFALRGRPRVELLSGVHWATDEEAAWEALAEVDLETVVAVGAGEASSITGEARSRATSVGSFRQVGEDWSVENRGDLELEVTTGEPALLVLRDAYFPGWTVSLDQEAREVVHVDGAFMGVRVPPGTHRVRFRYRTPGLTLGLYLSLPAWLALIGLLSWPRLREVWKKDPRP